MLVSGMLVQPARNRANKQASPARGICDAVCLLIMGCVLYTSEEAGNPYRQDSRHNQVWGDACYSVPTLRID